MASQRRLDVLHGHLNPASASQIVQEEAAGKKPEKFRVQHTVTASEGSTLAPSDLDLLNKLLDDGHFEFRSAIKNLIREDIFTGPDALPYNMTYQQQRALSWAQLVRLREANLVNFDDMKTDPTKFFATVETSTLVPNYGLNAKIGVHFGLFTLSVLLLGTERHHTKYLAAADKLELPGCFAMTELRGGSNVRDLMTTATYDDVNDEIVINTPSDMAQKFWIGNSADTAHMAVVWAQLIVAGYNHGLHAFLVPIRSINPMNGQLEVCKNVTIREVGHKIGLNGIDNGRLWFNHVRIPRENMLNRFADIEKGGEYITSISNPNKRFAAQLGVFVVNRIGMASNACYLTEIGLTTAMRFSALRRQFGSEKGQPETIILDYLTHQRRLFPILASTYAYKFATNKYKRIIAETFRRTELARFQSGEGAASSSASSASASSFEERNADNGDVMKDAHIIASALKAFGSWEMERNLQTCREACGGQGYLSVNRFGSLRADGDHLLTVEGDNTVLAQSVAKALLDRYAAQFKKGGLAAVVAFAAKTAVTTVTEKNPMTTRDVQGAHIRDHEYLQRALAFRETKLVQILAKRLKQSQKKVNGMPGSANQAWNDNLDVAIQLARAHVDRITFDGFVDVFRSISQAKLRAWATGGSPPPASASATASGPFYKNAAECGKLSDAAVRGLNLLCSLHGLKCMSNDMSMFLCNGYVSPVKAAAVEREINNLCRELRPLAVSMVDAFGLPDHALGPIGKSDGYTSQFALNHESK